MVGVSRARLGTAPPALSVQFPLCDVMAFHLKSSETLDLTPELALEICNMPPSPTERELSEKRMKYLREEAEAGMLVTFHWSKAELDGKLYRANGHHSSLMLSKMNGNFPKGLKVHLDTWEVDDIESLGMLFKRFDNRNSARSVPDVAGAFQGLYAPVRDLPRWIAKLGLDGCLWHAQHVENLVLPKGDDRYALFNRTEYHGFLNWLPEVFDSKSREMQKKAIAAAMYATFRANETAAKAFWGSVARTGDPYNENDPTTVLDAWLKSVHEDKRVRELVKEPHLYQGSIFAWNAHRAKQSLSKVRTDSKKGFLDPAE